MANVFNADDATPINLTLKNNLKSYLIEDLGYCQIGIEVDTDMLGFKNHLGNYLSVPTISDVFGTINTYYIPFYGGDYIFNQSPLNVYQSGETTIVRYNTYELWHSGNLTGDQTGHYHSTDRDRANHTGSQAISTITNLQTALNSKWSSSNDGSGSGLDADLLDGYHANNFVGKNGSPYYQADGWIQFSGSQGLHFPNSGAGTHFHPNSSNYNYASFIIQGSGGGYQGFYFRDCVNGLTLMYRASDGLGGMYYQATSTWQWYYDPAIENIRIMGNYPVWHSGNLTGDQTGHYHTADRTAVYSGLTAGYIPRYNGSVFVNSLLFDDGVSNVGIGTVNPTNKLHISNTSVDTYTLITSGVGDLYVGGTKVGTVNPHSGIYDGIKIVASATVPFVIEHASNQPMVFGTNDTERVRISGGGNVGIGTNNPVTKLQVAGKIWADEHIISGTACYASHYEPTKAEQGSYIGVFKNVGSLPGYYNDYYPTIKTDANNIHFSCNGRNTGYLGNDEFGLLDSNMVGRIVFVTNGNSYIDPISGNFGIGISTPTYRLHVDGSFYATTMSRAGNVVWDAGNLIGIRNEHTHTNITTFIPENGDGITFTGENNTVNKIQAITGANSDLNLEANHDVVLASGNNIDILSDDYINIESNLEDITITSDNTNIQITADNGGVLISGANNEINGRTSHYGPLSVHGRITGEMLVGQQTFIYPAHPIIDMSTTEGVLFTANSASEGDYTFIGPVGTIIYVTNFSTGTVRVKLKTNDDNSYTEIPYGKTAQLVCTAVSIHSTWYFWNMWLSA